MTLSEEVRNAGQEVAAEALSLRADKLNAAIRRFVGWPY